MGRAGVTLNDIENAIYQLQGKGKPPTVDNIRELLGTGSKSTIIQHLKTWKSKHSEAQGNLPTDLLSLVTGLWERLNEKAEQRITEIETMSRNQLEESRQQLYQFQREHAELKIKFHEVEELLSHEKQSTIGYTQKLQQTEHEFAKLSERYQAAILQIEDHKSENTKLHQLATNIQANLEHYQQAVQQARIEQNLQMENQQIQFKQELNELQRTISIYQNQHHELQQKFHEKNVELQHLKEECDTLQKNNQDLTQKSQSTSHELIIYKDRHEQNRQHLSGLQNTLSEKAQQLTELEKQIAVLTDQCDKFQKTISLNNDKIELLRQEKLFLVQEKSDLMGQLKYFHEKMSKKAVPQT